MSEAVKWIIEYDNDTGANDDGFWERWTVTDGTMSFESRSEADAKWLVDRILQAGFHKTLDVSELPTFVTSIVFDDGGVDAECEVVRLFDLRRLVAPVQSSAVVSREAIGAIVESTGGPIYGSIAKLTDSIHALQLTKPQTVGRVPSKDELQNFLMSCGETVGRSVLLAQAILTYLQSPTESEVKP